MKLKEFKQEIIKEENTLSSTVQLSNTMIRDEELLKLLKIERNNFLSLDYTINDDLITITSDISIYTRLNDSDLMLLERYKIAFKLLDYLDLEDNVLIPLIHPDNIVLDVNNDPYLFYRGLASYLEPAAFNEADVLMQIKCLCYTLVEDTNDFESLYNGELAMNQNNDFKQKLVKANSKEELETLLLEVIEYQEKLEAQKNVYVKKSRYSLFRNASLIFMILSIIFIGVSAYAYLIERPKLNDYIEAGNQYVNKDYSAVIDTLAGYDLADLPKPQKQILASSSINVLSLTPEQKQRVLVGITTSTNDATLDSWISLGKGNYEAAVDSAIKSADLDLQLYALVRYKDALIDGESFKELSGSEIKAQLDNIDKQIEEIMKDEGVTASE